MTKSVKPIWICTDCGEEATTWAGRCANCGAWNTLKEVHLPAVTSSAAGRATTASSPEVISLSSPQPHALPDRISCRLDEVDRVLGGGFFPGTVALLAGEPGIGKSTLLLSIAHAISQQVPVLYASGEESTEQIEQRAQRLGLVPSQMRLVALTSLSALLTVLATEEPKFLIVDSIQTIVDEAYPSAAGSIVQVRECALALQRWAKSTGSTLVIVGHVTKEGAVAGPRTLEHLVDIVVTLEGERTSDLRLIRAQKNRFGPTDEVGILAMTSAGLETVANPSARFMSEQAELVPGSITTVILEGSRPLLVEIQALTRPTNNPYPRRTASGFDLNRLELLIAVLEARAGVDFRNLDCYVNVSGGLRIREPAADLGVALAVASAAMRRTIPHGVVAFGEIGLAGEIRRVIQAERRSQEAERLGFTRQIKAGTLREAINQLKQISTVGDGKN